MKRTIKDICYRLLSLATFRSAVILMYHSVGDNNEFFTVKPRDFEKQMAHISKNGFNVISLTELVGLISSKKNISRKTVAVTFDDGYEDNYLNALPILKKYRIPATIFVSTALIGKTIRARRGTELRILSENEIREAANENLIEFGSHGSEHVKFTNESLPKLRGGLLESKKRLEELTGRKITHVAYPWGDYNSDVVETARSIFSSGYTVRPGRVGTGDDLFRLKRNSVDSEVSIAQFSGIVKFGRI
jgi:peptidoglycan/xylan/chitin deacetylase (PgdA/CDA1 family)